MVETIQQIAICSFLQAVGKARESHDPDAAREWAGRLKELEGIVQDDPNANPGELLISSDVMHHIKMLEYLGFVIPERFKTGGIGSVFWLEQAFKIDQVWKERLGQTPAQSPNAKTLAEHGEDYIHITETRYQSGQISASECEMLRRSIQAFAAWAGPRTTVEKVNPQLWERWYLHLIGNSSSVAWSKKQWRHSRDFINHLIELNIIAPLPNLRSPRYRFQAESHSIETFTIEEIKTLLGISKGRLRLFVLLALNCGFTQQDCADLNKDEVNYDEGRIIRHRSKTGSKSPRVNYLLWPETIKLLRVYRDEHDVLAFTNECKLPWVRRNPKTKTDGIMTLWRKIKDKVGNKPPKLLRKTGATMLKNSKDYGDLDWYYLAHSPRSVADRHYSAISQERVDASLLWLAKQFGLVK